MILLDTNVLIYVSDLHSPFYEWSHETIIKAVVAGGAAINAVTLAELCVGDSEPRTVADRVRSWGVRILDVPAAVAEPCAVAYKHYRERRLRDSGKQAPSMPLPDFLIGAHALVMGWELATADEGRFSTYFPSIKLKTPQ